MRVRVPVGHVQYALNQFFEIRELQIREEREKLIAEAIRPPGRVRRFFGAKPLTREQAITKLVRTSDSRFDNEWYMPEVVGAAWAMKAKKIQTLINATTEEFVILTEDDAWLFKY